MKLHHNPTIKFTHNPFLYFYRSEHESKDPSQPKPKSRFKRAAEAESAAANDDGNIEEDSKSAYLRQMQEYKAKTGGNDADTGKWLVR